MNAKCLLNEYSFCFFFGGGHKIILECDNSCITLENTKSHLDYTLQYCESYVNFTSIK